MEAAQPRPPLRRRGRRAAVRARDRRLLLQRLLRRPGDVDDALGGSGSTPGSTCSTSPPGRSACSSPASPRAPTRSASAPSNRAGDLGLGARRRRRDPRLPPGQRRRRRAAPRRSACSASPRAARHRRGASEATRGDSEARAQAVGEGLQAALALAAGCGGAARAGPGRRWRRRRRRPRPPGAPSCAGRAAPAARSRRAPRPSRRAPRRPPAVTAERVSSSRPESRSGGSIGRSASAQQRSTSQLPLSRSLGSLIAPSPPAAA